MTKQGLAPRAAGHTQLSLQGTATEWVTAQVLSFPPDGSKLTTSSSLILKITHPPTLLDKEVNEDKAR